jgi:hypothetical protein
MNRIQTNCDFLLVALLLVRGARRRHRTPAQQEVTKPVTGFCGLVVWY